MELTVTRRYKSLLYTIGKLEVNHSYFCDTLEDPCRQLDDSMTHEQIQQIKVYGQTAIPTGTYKIDMDTISPKFKDRSWARFCGGKLPRLLNVKGFEGVLIHVGNKPEDTLGCILVGQNKVKGQVINSTATFEKLYKVMQEAHLRGELITITVKD